MSKNLDAIYPHNRGPGDQRFIWYHIAPQLWLSFGDKNYSCIVCGVQAEAWPHAKTQNHKFIQLLRGYLGP